MSVALQAADYPTETRGETRKGDRKLDTSAGATVFFRTSQTQNTREGNVVFKKGNNDNSIVT